MHNQLGGHIIAQIFKANTSLYKAMHEVQMRQHEQVSSFTSTNASSSSLEVLQASSTHVV
jgi:uncharacterized membrane protein YcgQ (UPF0703/DUF1980 family)